MGNWHKYWRSDNPLIAERYFVYRGGPRNAPVPQGSAETVDQGNQNAEKKETPEQIVKRSLDTVKWIDDMRGFLKAPKYKNIKKFTQFDKRLGEIQKKLEKILRNNEDSKAEVMTKTLSLLGETSTIYQDAMKAYRKKFGLPEPANKPKKVTSKLKGSTERSKEKIPTDPKGKLSYLLGKVIEGGDEAFKNNKAEITKLISSLKFKPGRVNMPVGQDLPNGFTVSHVNWSDPKGRPNFAIFKDGKTICYMQDDKNGKSQLVPARELGQNERPMPNRRMVELIKANVLLPKALSKIKINPKTKRLVFTSPSALNDFKASLIAMAKMSKLDKKAGPDWEAVYGGMALQFERKGEGSFDGEFKIKVGNNIMHFDTSLPNQIGVDAPGWKENGKKGISYRHDGDFLFTPKEQKQNDREESILKDRAKAKEKQKKVNDILKKKLDAQRDKKEAAKELKAKQEKALRGKVNKLINPDFKKLVKASKDKPNSFTVKAEQKNKKGLSLIDNTPIHKLLELDKNKTEVVILTIKGAKEKPERKAMYYPGQKTAYVLNPNGEQTNNRVKFFNGDTIAVDFKKPTKTEYSNLNRDKNKLIRSPEKIEGYKAASQLFKAIGQFKGKVTDLNLKPLGKYKSKNYDPKQILTFKNWTKSSIKKLGIKKSTEIIRAEIKVIQESKVKPSRVASKPRTKVERRTNA